MPAVRIVTQEEVPPVSAIPANTSATSVWTYLGVTLVLLAVIGTWLV